jgi:hypothetical protein
MTRRKKEKTMMMMISGRVRIRGKMTFYIVYLKEYHMLDIVPELSHSL